jgi:hypothetical protein
MHADMPMCMLLLLADVDVQTNPVLFCTAPIRTVLSTFPG